MVENKNISTKTNSSTHDTSKQLERLANDTSDFPLNSTPLSHQVAGHFYGQGRTKLGLLQTNDGLILKPVQSPPHGQREHDFYKRIFSKENDELNKDELELRPLLPTYRGWLIHNKIVYIKMDDVAFRFKHPAVVDLKLGRVTHDPEASPDKIYRHRSRYPPAERLGFQLIGMRVFSKQDQSFAHLDKIFGRGLTEENLIHGLALYFQFHQQPQLTAIRECIRKFAEVKNWFERQRTYHFYASSLIVIYEANLEEDMMLSGGGGGGDQVDVNNNTTSAVDLSSSVKIFMADFAHVFPAKNESDQNYLFGLEKLIEHLTRLIQPDYKFVDLRVRN